MNRSSNYSDPRLFWEERLSKNFDLTGVGYAPLGPVYNLRIYQARLNGLIKALEITKLDLEGKNILEIGCGTGFYIDFLKKQCISSYTGLDITDVSIQNLSKRYPELEFIRADIGDADFSIDRRFDIILIADVLFHIVDDMRFNAAITNISKLLVPNGALLVSDLFTKFSVDTKQHCYWRSISQYATALAKNGLVIQHIQPMFAIFHPPTRVIGTTLFWQAYALLWKYALLRLARFRWFDQSLSSFLSEVDKKIFLPRSGIDTPNNKWMIARKNVG